MQKSNQWAIAYPNQKLVFDIETAGLDFNSFDETSKELILKSAESEQDQKTIIEQLGLSPTTGQVVVIGILNPDTNKGAVFINSDKNHNQQIEEDIEIFSGTEKEILEKFWQTANHYNYFISFNGRGFDVPFLMIRSAIYGIKPTKNLMSNRYTSLQKYEAIHIDLFDQLSSYGASRFKFSGLHFYTKAFGIKSPKEDGVEGSDVSQFFKDGKILEIALYNIRDIKATSELYKKWNEFLNI